MGPETRQLEYRVTKDKIRWVLRQPDGRILPSTRFELMVQEADGAVKEVSAAGKGNGHGLGLSQAGAVHVPTGIRIRGDPAALLIPRWTLLS